MENELKMCFWVKVNITTSKMYNNKCNFDFLTTESHDAQFMGQLHNCVKIVVLKQLLQ